MDLSEVLNDQDTCQTFTILRSQGGTFAAGGWQEPAPQSLSAYGVVSIADAKTIETVPESDEIHEAIVVNSVSPMYTTRAGQIGGPATADKIVWNGETYRVLKSHNYASRGYWWAIAGRMAGD
jgi:hypothetical protein